MPYNRKTGAYYAKSAAWGQTKAARRWGKSYIRYRRAANLAPYSSQRSAAIKRRRASISKRVANRDVIMGFGRYYRKRGAALKEPGIPRVQNTSDGVIVRHCEFLVDVPSSIVFSSTVVPLNPGMPETFPWLSRVAQNFEEWLPRGIVVEYRTTSSDTLLAANPALGSVIIATQYNSANPDFTNKQQIENYEGAISCKPSVSMLHQVETKRSQTQTDQFYTRVADPPANTDIRMYDLGKVQIATVGSQAAGNIIGEIWISYEIELRKPKIPADPIVEAAHFMVHAASVAGEAPATPFGNTTADITIPTTGSTMPTARLIGGAAFGTVNFGSFARGFYMVVCRLQCGVVGNQGVWTFANFVGCGLINAWVGNTAASAVEVDGATASAATCHFAIVVNVVLANASFTCTNNSTQTTPGSTDLYIIELPDSLN